MLLIVRRDPDLMQRELAQAAFEAAMADQKRRGGDLVACGAHGNPDRIVVGKLVGEAAEAADLLKRRTAPRDRGAEAGFGQL